MQDLFQAIILGTLDLKSNAFVSSYSDAFDRMKIRKIFPESDLISGASDISEIQFRLTGQPSQAQSTKSWFSQSVAANGHMPWNSRFYHLQYENKKELPYIFRFYKGCCRFR